MTDTTVYRTKARYTREEITEAMTQLPENSWMTPPEGFIGAYRVTQIGSGMPMIIGAAQFSDQFEAEDAIVESVQASKPAAAK